MAEFLTEDCTTDYERIRAIYEWECDNISYDTTYSIYTADSCYNERRGVCQAYCEMFYYLAAAVGIKAEIVNGISKDHTGIISNRGHVWIFAYTSEDRGILLDPTWGAGYVKDSVFTRRSDHSEWFDVDPEWMILTHFPDIELYQFLEKPFTKEEFAAIPVANPLWTNYGLTKHYIVEHLRDSSLVLPKFYNQGEGYFQIVDIPLCDSLRIGETYTFRIKMLKERDFIIINKPTFCKRPEWREERDSVYAVEFMPRDTTRVTLGLADLQRPNFWNNVLEYAVKPPTAADWAKVEQKYPLSVPDAKYVGHLEAKDWERVGIDGHRLLQLIREQQVTDLPTLFFDKGQNFQIVSVPMNRVLKVGESYTFSFIPKSRGNWAIVTNGKDWFKDWQENGNVLTMTVTPTSKGTLYLYMQKSEGGMFWSSMQYTVE